MDASQYKDYVLTMLFLKYITDRYSKDEFAIIEIPEDATFDKISKLKGNKEIGDKPKDKDIITKENTSENLADLVYNNLVNKYGDVVRIYGHEIVGDAILNITSNAGTTDIDKLTLDVIQQLKRHIQLKSS